MYPRLVWHQLISMWNWIRRETVADQKRAMMTKGSFVYRLIVTIGVLSLWAMSAYSQSVYHVRVGAAGPGNGSDWINAYTSLPATLQRGATYYVTGGSYPSYTFNTAQSGTTIITVKRAFPTDRGTGTRGWRATARGKRCLHRSLA